MMQNVSVRERLSVLWKAPRAGLYSVLGAVILIWTLQCTLLQNVVGLDVLEALSWGSQGDLWGNVKHPPLSGWVAVLFSRLAGGHDWGLYLAAELCVTAGIWCTWRLALLFFDEYRAAASALLLCSLYYYVPSLLKFSTFFVEITLTSAVAWAFFAALRKKTSAAYALLGLLCGAGILNKYTIGLLFLAMAAVVLTDPEYRQELKTPRPYLALAVFLVVISPHLHYLVTHDFSCLAHVKHRVAEEVRWYDPLLTLVTALGPSGIVFMFLGTATLLQYRSLERIAPLPRVFRWSFIFSALPAVIFVVSAFCGNRIFMMWFSSFAAFTGIMIVAVWPWRIDARVFRNLYILIWLYIAFSLCMTSHKLIFTSLPRLHSEPRSITAPALGFWRAQTEAPPRLVVGDRWYGNIMVRYSGAAPILCEIDDELGDHWRRSFLDRVAEEGAMVIGSKAEHFTAFAEAFRKKYGYAIDFSHRITYTYKAPRGKVRSRSFFVTRIPPAKERLRRP